MKTKWRLLMPIFLCLILITSLAYGGWVWYDANVDRSGWYEENGLHYYRNFYGDPLSGWQEVEGNIYFFREDGSALTHWQELSGNRYYFGSHGIMARGWQTVDGGRRYFGADGIQRSGWLTLDGQTYYLPDGVMVTGWQDIDGHRHYFTEGGLMALGFASIEGEKYYFGDNGIMVTGEATLLGQQYFFREDGAMQTGWLETETGRRYYLPEGPMALGWQIIGDNKYYFQETGYPLTGWYQEGEYRFYFHSDGTAATGPNEIDGATHYFTPKGREVVLVNQKNMVPDWYELELKTVFAHHQASVTCYDALMAMLEGCTNAGIEYEFNSAYRSVKTQQEILAYRTESYMAAYELTRTQARLQALRSVASPGTSEHHLGLAVDLLGEEAQAWFREHCWEYGFIIRYLENKEAYTGIMNEPWHFRYVGREIALDLKENGLCLEEYLGAEAVKPWLLENG